MTDERFVARLVFLTEGIEKSLNDVSRIAEAGGDVGKQWGKSERDLAKFISGFKQLAASTEGANKGLKGSADASRDAAAGWDRVARSIQGVRDATREAARAQYTSQFGDSGFSGAPVQGMSRQQLQAYIGAFDAENLSPIALARQRLTELDDAAQGFASKNAPRLRYALYDVATTANLTAAAITAVGVAVSVMSARYESAFTNVERTLDGLDPAGVAELREELIGLTREIPLAFADVAQIATLGNQLGIASGDVAQFTETVAKFSAVTGLTAEASAQAFGALGELLNVDATEYENLGSAIALVGRRSVATEQEIVAVTTRLAASATTAGFTAQQVVALSGALASLRVAPERAQGVLEVYFNRLNTAVAQGGERLEAFARYARVAAGDVEGLVKSDPVGFFERLSAGLGSLDKVAQTRALEELGLDGIRAGEVFGRVSANLDVFGKAMDDANQGWREGSELANQYALVVDDLASRWQIFLNAVGEAGATIGTVLAPAIKGALDVTAELLQAFSAFADTSLGQGLIVLSAVFAALTAIIAGVIGAASLGAASFFALSFAMKELGITAVFATGGFKGLFLALLGVGGAATAASVGLRILRVALIGTGIGALIVGLGTAIGFLVDFEGSVMSLAGPIRFLIDSIFGIADAFLGTIAVIAQSGASLPLIGDGFANAANTVNALKGNLEALRATSQSSINQMFIDSAKAARGADTTSVAYDELLQALEGIDEEAGGAADGLDGLGSSAANAGEQVRTLVDYANDLSSVFKRSFDIRFGSQQGLDTIASAWNKIEQSTADAREEIAKYQASQRQLTADRNIKAYFLSIAELYGDTLRAAKLREELADIDREQTKTQKGLTNAQNKNNKTLEGNSEAAIENRAQLLGLVGNYQDYLTALASSGASQETVARESQRLRNEFVQQATRMGFNRQEVEKYASAFDDMTLAIGRVPRNITVTANTNPALQALAEFAAKARNTQIDIPITSRAGNSGFSAGTAYASAFKTAMDEVLKKANVRLIPGGNLRFDSNGRMIEGNVGNLRFFKEGGYTGSAGVNDIAGFVHGKEFVMSAPAVRNAGGPQAMGALHEILKRSGGSVAGGGSTGIGRWNAADIDSLARAIAYYSKDPGITPGAVQGALVAANMAGNSQGRY
jgi:TP901 family phage tail tape measure protein